jgi:hypothetical protein
VTLPARRLWDIVALARLMTPMVPLSIVDTPERRISLLRLVLRYTVGMALYLDKRADAARLFHELREKPWLFLPCEVPPLCRSRYCWRPRALRSRRKRLPPRRPTVRRWQPHAERRNKEMRTPAFEERQK